MEIIKFKLCEKYGYLDDTISNTEMTLLAWFLVSEVGCPPTTWEDWILNDDYNTTSGNIISLDKEDDYIYLTSFIFDEEEEHIELKILQQQLLQLIYDWKEKVCKRMPKEVTIIRNGDDFTLDTKD